MKLNKRFWALNIFAVILAFCLALSSCSLVVIKGDEDKNKAEETVTKPIDTENESNFSEVDGTDDTSNSVAEGIKQPESPSDKAKKRVDALANFDFGKQSFIIATTSSMTFATDGDSYYDRVLLLRDSIVEEKYNVDIITVFSDEGRIETDLRNAALADDYFADLISVPEYRIGRLAAEGLIMNLRTLPFYSVESAYSDSKESAAGNAVYADIGAASADFSRIYGVFFNRTVAESLGYDLDKMVDEGEWTWDTFDRISRMATEQLGIVGQGSAAMGNEYTDVVFRSANEKLVDNTLGQTPVISFDSQRLEAIVELTCNLIYGNPAAYKPADGTKSSFVSLFSSGQLFLAVAPLYYMSDFSVCDVQWGILPIPKYDEGQSRYYGYTEAGANVLALPAENNKLEMTGVMINALNTASYELLAEEYKTNCLYNYFRDAKAMRSMDAVLDSITFDFTYLYASGADLLAAATYGCVREARTSTTAYATNLINERLEAANAQLAELFGEKVFEDDVQLPIPEDTENEDDITESGEPEEGEAEETSAADSEETAETAEIAESTEPETE